jgi:hypothetical protein
VSDDTPDALSCVYGMEYGVGRVITFHTECTEQARTGSVVVSEGGAYSVGASSRVQILVDTPYA